MKYLILLLFLSNAWLQGATISKAYGEETIKLALILAQSGAGKQSDASGWGAARLATEQINNAGGVLGRKIELIMLDSKSTPIGATLAAKMAIDKNVAGVIGAGWSSQSMSMAKVLQEEGIPMITPTSTHPGVTRIGNYIFRVCFNDTFQGGALAKFAHEDMQASTAIIFRNVGESYSFNLAREFESFFQQHGGKVLHVCDYKTNTSDFSECFDKIESLTPDVVFIGGYERDSGMILRQAGSLGIHSRFLGGDGWGKGIREIAGSAANNSFYLSQWHQDFPNVRSRQLIDRFKKQYPSSDSSSIMVPLTYDAVFLMADAIGRAGSTEGEAIRNALSKTKGFKGVTGTIQFDANGDPISRNGIILKFTEQESDSVFHKAISYP